MSRQWLLVALVVIHNMIFIKTHYFVHNIAYFFYFIYVLHYKKAVSQLTQQIIQREITELDQK